MNIKNKINKNKIKINTYNDFSNEKYYNFFLTSFTMIFSIYIISCDKIILNDNTNFKNANYIEKVYNFEDKFENVIINGNFEIEFVKCDSQYVVVDNIIEHSFSQIRPIINLKNGDLIINELNNKIENKHINSYKFDDCSNKDNLKLNKSKLAQNKIDNIIKENDKQNNKQNKKQKLKLIIYTNRINKLKVTGNSKVYSNETFNFDSMKCFIEGNSYINFNIVSNKFDIYSNGNSCFILKGKVLNLKMDIVGNENINFNELNIINSEIKIAGNSNVILKVEEKLKAEILGNAKIILLNNPKIVESDITGKGFIRK
jgi:hypothetical protein